MTLETSQIYLIDPAEVAPFEAALERWCRSRPGSFGAGNLPGCWGAGQFSVELRGASAEELEALPGVARVDRLRRRPIGGGLREPELSGGILRTLLFKVRDGVADAQVAALERELLAMPDYMAGIRNWRLSRVVAGRHWTHVWQQEFADLGDLQGEYMLHPYHWGWVDRWFDPAFPEWTVESIYHAFCPLPASILATTR